MMTIEANVITDIGKASEALDVEIVSSQDVDTDERITSLLQEICSGITLCEKHNQEMMSISQQMVEDCVRTGKSLYQLQLLRRDVANQRGARIDSFELFCRRHIPIGWTTVTRYMSVAKKFGKHLTYDAESEREVLPPAEEWQKRGLPNSVTAAYKMVRRQSVVPRPKPQLRGKGPPPYIKASATLVEVLSDWIEQHPIAEMSVEERQQIQDCLAPIEKILNRVRD